jgi:hypothetical protein
MKHPYFVKQDHSDTTAFSLAYFGAQFDKQRLDVPPLQVCTRGAGKDQFERALVLPPHP